MTHDPLCVLSKPCDDETPEHGYCGFSAPNFCIQCQQWCMCGEVRQAEQRMLAKCIAAVDAVEGGYSIPLGMSVGAFIDAMRHEFVAGLRALEEKP